MVELESCCRICNKKFHVSPAERKRGGGKYCSTICQGKGKSIAMKNLPKELTPRWKGGDITRICGYCNKTFKTNRSKINQERVFCSKQCNAKYNVPKRPKTGKIIKCKVCNTEKYCNLFSLSRSDRNQGIFCSMRCRALYNIQNQKLDETDIERIMEGWLKENKIDYTKQFIIGKVSVVDFFIPPNILIYCDGDYWHSLPNTKKRDEWQNKVLYSRGYRVIRLTGKEIKKGVRPVEILNKL